VSVAALRTSELDHCKFVRLKGAFINSVSKSRHSHRLHSYAPPQLVPFGSGGQLQRKRVGKFTADGQASKQLVRSTWRQRCPALKPAHPAQRHRASATRYKTCSTYQRATCAAAAAA